MTNVNARYEFDNIINDKAQSFFSHKYLINSIIDVGIINIYYLSTSHHMIWSDPLIVFVNI